MSGLGGTVTGAKLRLYVSNGTTDGPALYRAADGWSEGTVTWATKPATGAAIEDKGAVPANGCLEYDLSRGIGRDGTYTFALAPESSNCIAMNSREAASNRPQLVGQFEPG